MVRPYFIFFEIGVYICFIACLWHAKGQSWYRVAEILFAAVYGLLLEILTIKQFSSYHYGHFLIMIFDTPLAVALGWAAIIYSTMEFADRLDMPDYVRPILGALLALNVDIVLDPVAGRMGMWTWTQLGPNDQWFGVPWGNFFGWFVVILSYSGLLRILRRWQTNQILRWLYIPVSFIVSLILVLVLDQLYLVFSTAINNGFVGIATCVVVSLIIFVVCRPRMMAGDFELDIVAVPLVFHVLTASAGIYYGYYFQNPALGIISLIMAVLGIIVAFSPWWATRQRTLAATKMA
ncbi:MAG: carotenoid biosynthesis protein [Chloroflexota bacterium]